MFLLLCFLLLVVLSYGFHDLNALKSLSRSSLNMVNNFDAILFDCDGVLAETERDVHRVTFNEAFRSKGIDSSVNWDAELYGELLKIGGGKERMTGFFNRYNNWPDFVEEENRTEFIKDLHLTKTGMFKGLVESGAVPLRPGVQRLVDDAFANGLKVAVCSTSSVDAVTTIVRTLLGEERLAKIPIFAGDMVKAKKPSPDVYNLAAETLEVDPARCWVIEDSHIGLNAGKSAGMNVCVTKSIYTEEEDFTGNDLCVKDLDSGLDGPITVRYLNYKLSSKSFKNFMPTDNAEMFSAASQLDKMAKMIGDPGKMFGV